MRLLRSQPRSAETTPHSASSTTKLQRRQYSMMTQRRRQRLNRLRTTLPSHDQLQKRAVLAAHGQRMLSPEIVTTSAVDGSTVIFATRHLSTRYSSSTHPCDTSLVDTLIVINPLSETQQQRRRYVGCATVSRTTVSARSTAFRSSGTDQIVTLKPASRRSPVQRLAMIHQPYSRSHPSNKTSPSSHAPGIAPPARG